MCIVNTSNAAAALSSITASSNIVQLMKYANIGYIDYSGSRYKAYGVSDGKAFKLTYSGYGLVPQVVEKHSTASSSSAALSG